jgi:hypothetical protein
MTITNSAGIPGPDDADWDEIKEIDVTESG